MSLNWTSSSGATGAIDFRPAWGGAAVRDEHGSGGTTRPVVLVNGADACNNYSAVTRAFEGQAPGVPLQDKFVVLFNGAGGLAGACEAREIAVDQFHQAGVAGALYMFSGDSGRDGRRSELTHGPGIYEKRHPGRNVSTMHPLAGITRERAGSNPAMPMLLEIKAGHTVDLFWPGTGPIDAGDRAALKEYYGQGMKQLDFSGCGPELGASPGTVSREAFLADDALDPCGGSGDPTSRLAGVYCVGGRVVGIDIGYCSTTEIHYFPESFGNLSQLRWVFNHLRPSATDADVVVFPESFGNLTELRAFVWCGENGGRGQRFQMPQSLAGLTKLRLVDIDTLPLANAFPMDMFTLPSLEWVTLHHVPLTVVPDATSMVALQYFNLKDNNLTSALPSFKGLGHLKTVSLAQNSLSGGQIDMFDGCHALETVDMSNNRYIDSPLFHFVGCLNLTSILLGGNRITGSVPGTWSKLTNVFDVSLVNNRIGGPGKSSLSPLKGMTSLEFLDLSRNRFEYEPESSCAVPCQVEPWTVASFPSSVKILDISHNNFTSPDGVIIRFERLGLPSIEYLKASHNHFRGHLFASCTRFNCDLSFNDLAGMDTDMWFYDTEVEKQKRVPALLRNYHAGFNIADSIFGNGGRVKEGLDTSWHVKPGVAIRSHAVVFSQSNLAENDLLAVYEGDSKTNARLYSFSASKPPQVGKVYDVPSSNFLLHYLRAKPHVMISYRHLDAEFAHKIEGALQRSGFKVWIDTAITPGEDWRQDIALAIKKSIAVVFIVTPASVRSRYCKEE
eukprot:g3642.t1